MVRDSGVDTMFHVEHGVERGDAADADWETAGWGPGARGNGKKDD
jgi:hypothetical protein